MPPVKIGRSAWFPRFFYGIPQRARAPHFHPTANNSTATMNLDIVAVGIHGGLDMSVYVKSMDLTHNISGVWVQGPGFGTNSSVSIGGADSSHGGSVMARRALFTRPLRRRKHRGMGAGSGTYLSTPPKFASRMWRAPRQMGTLYGSSNRTDLLLVAGAELFRPAADAAACSRRPSIPPTCVLRMTLPLALGLLQLPANR